MPEVQEGESKDQFIKRCVPIVVREGTAENGTQAVAICNSMWDQHEQAQMSQNTADVTCTWLDAEARRKGQFRKDVIKVGSFVHPNTGQQVDVSQARIDHWRQAFHEMQAAGINIPIREGHEGKPLGHIAGAKVIGDKLEMLHDFPDDDAVQTAKRNRFVSVGVVPTYTDCHGKTWHDVIEHVALTPTPVITGQSEFVALSREQNNQPAPQDGVTGKHEDESMDWLNDELGLKPDATEDEAKARIAELKARPEKVEPKPSPAVTADPEVLAIRREAISERLDLAQKDGRLTKAKRDAFEAAVLGTLESPHGICLDRRASGTDKALASIMLDLLLMADQPVADGEQSGPQVTGAGVELTRSDEPTAADQEKQTQLERDQVRYQRLKDLAATGTQLTDDAKAWMSRFERDKED